MNPNCVVVAGVVKNGVVVPTGGTPLPEGAAVEIVIRPPEIPDELRDEFAAWERLSDEAWQLMDDLEKEGQG